MQSARLSSPWLTANGTFIFEKVAHARASREDQLRDVLDNLGLFLGRQGGEPFGEALGYVSFELNTLSAFATHHLALAGQENQMPRGVG